MVQKNWKTFYVRKYLYIALAQASSYIFCKNSHILKPLKRFFFAMLIMIGRVCQTFPDIFRRSSSYNSSQNMVRSCFPFFVKRSHFRELSDMVRLKGLADPTGENGYDKIFWSQMYSNFFPLTLPSPGIFVCSAQPPCYNLSSGCIFTCFNIFCFFSVRIWVYSNR